MTSTALKNHLDGLTREHVPNYMGSLNVCEIENFFKTYFSCIPFKTLKFFTG